MGGLKKEDKDALLDEQTSLKKVQATWAGTAGVLSSVALVISPAGVFALPIAVGAIALTVLKHKQYAVERVLEDPPRFDYEVATRARRRRYETGMLGNSPLALATDQVVIATLRAASYFEASVRANERAQGARIVGGDELSDWHLAEASRLFETGKAWEGEMSAAWDAHAIAWAAFAVDNDFDEVGLPTTVGPAKMSPAARQAVNRTRLVFDDRAIARRIEVERVEMLPGRSTVGDLALENAVSSRGLSWSAARVSGGARALSERAVEPRRVPPAISEDDLRVMGSGRSGEVGDLERRLLSFAEEGSPDAAFDLGAIAYARGDRVQARTFLDRASAQIAPLAAEDYSVAVERASEVEPARVPKELEPSRAQRRPEVDRNLIERYWHALSDNGRKVFAAAARIEEQRGPGYTLEDIAENLDLGYASVRSMHRSTGRTAKAWRRDTGTEEPIKLEWQDYDWDESRAGNRTVYHLPPGVARVIKDLSAEAK